MKTAATDHMKYLDTMEAVDSDIMNNVLKMVDSYDYHRYTAGDVRAALNKETLSPEDFAALLSLFLRKWPIKPLTRPGSISEMPSVCSRPSISPITAKTTAFIADLTAKIGFTGPN